MMIRAPNCFDFPLLDPSQRSRIHVGQLGTPKPIEQAQCPCVIIERRGENGKPRQRRDKGPQASRRLLAMTVEEPRIGFRDYQQRSNPARPGASEKLDRLGVQAIAPAERGDEDPGIKENDRTHGASRP